MNKRLKGNRCWLILSTVLLGDSPVEPLSAQGSASSGQKGWDSYSHIDLQSTELRVLQVISFSAMTACFMEWYFCINSFK